MGHSHTSSFFKAIVIREMVAIHGNGQFLIFTREGEFLNAEISVDENGIIYLDGERAKLWKIKGIAEASPLFIGSMFYFNGHNSAVGFILGGIPFADTPFKFLTLNLVEGIGILVGETDL